MKRLLVATVVLFAIPFSWHLYLIHDVDDRIRELNSDPSRRGTGVDIKVNPITNLITTTITLPPQLANDENPFSALGVSLAQGMLETFGPGILEREINSIARESYDLYAIILPYRVLVRTVRPSLDTLRKWEITHKQEEERKRELEAAQQREMDSYISQYISLENLRVAPGESYGETVKGIFGTLVNKGPKTLNKVRFRVYFLDSGGNEIGEEDYTPVLVTDYPIGDNTPLRPNYRKDFGYDIEKYAPSGWEGSIKVKIVEIEFGDPSTDQLEATSNPKPSPLVDGVFVKVVVDKAYGYQSPDLTLDPVISFEKNTFLVVADKKDEWIKVKTVYGSCWIPASNVKIIK